MDVLHNLSVALGLAALAGLNLYLTVFVTGLALHFGWVILPASLEQLNVLGDPWIIAIAGVLYVLEFFADKIPWVDSANDSIHTIIRPVGAALLAVLALGHANPIVQVIAALLGGGIALTTHAAKAGTRLIANTSPEPVSNIGLSLGEDVVVLGGLGFLAWHPLVAGGTILVLLVLIWILLPRLLRSIKATLWLAWRKLNQAPEEPHDITIPHKLPDSCELLLRRAHASTQPIILSVPCVSGGGPRLPRNFFGWLVRFESGRLFFVSRSWFNSVVLEIPLERTAVERESRFLAEKLILSPGGTSSLTFLFERGRKPLADAVAQALREPDVTAVELTPVS